MNEPVPAPDLQGVRPSLVQLTHVIYALHAFSVLTGIFGAASVIGAFLVGWPSIIAVILNYVKRSDVAGTWLTAEDRHLLRLRRQKEQRARLHAVRAVRLRVQGQAYRPHAPEGPPQRQAGVLGDFRQLRKIGSHQDQAFHTLTPPRTGCTIWPQSPSGGCRRPARSGFHSVRGAAQTGSAGRLHPPVRRRCYSPRRRL